jgi:hypothetical protein
MYSHLPKSVSRSSFRFRPMWQVVQAHFHPPALGGRLRSQPRWSTASESMYIERDFADMNCMFSCATSSSLTPFCRRIIPIMYLPKTWPSHPISSRESIFGPLSSSTVYKTVSLHPVWPPDVPPKAMATVPTVEASFAVTCIYTKRIAHRIAAVLSIQRHIPFRSNYSSKA